MMTWITLAIRNLFRNGRRSFFTILAISLGFAAVNALGGFTDYIFTNLKNAYIYNQANGHLCIFRQGFLDDGKLNPTKYLLDEVDMSIIQKVIQKYPEIEIATPQLHISGLISNGQVSTIFVASGRVPSEVRAINSFARDGMSKMKLFDGQQLEDSLTYGVGLSKGLAEQLKFELGATAVTMAPTVSGQLNALDAQILQVFNAPAEALQDKLMLVPLKFAQSLYDTTGVDRLIVLLQSDEKTDSMRTNLAQEFAKQGLKLDVKTWNELNPFYTKVKKMFDVIFLFTFLIVFTIVVMSVINTVGMAIMERTREIGTLRALGLKRRGVIGLFAIESMLLGVFGSLFGVILTLSVWWGIKVMQPTWIPPQLSSRIPLEIYLVPYYMFYSILLLVVLSLIAACLPARRAAREEIVNALGHV